MASSSARAFGTVLACALIAACAIGAAVRSAPSHGDEGHKSYFLPAVEILAMDAGVNRAGRLSLRPANYGVSLASIRRNLRGPWVVDDDPFEINQFLHPYQGAMYHGISQAHSTVGVFYTFLSSGGFGAVRR